METTTPEIRATARPLEDRVEQDLVISRALVKIFEDDHLSEALAFRGGTALYPAKVTERHPKRRHRTY